MDQVFLIWNLKWVGVFCYFFSQVPCISSTPLNALCPGTVTHSVSGMKEGTQNKCEGWKCEWYTFFKIIEKHDMRDLKSICWQVLFVTMAIFQIYKWQQYFGNKLIFLSLLFKKLIRMRIESLNTYQPERLSPMISWDTFFFVVKKSGMIPSLQKKPIELMFCSYWWFVPSPLYFGSRGEVLSLNFCYNCWWWGHLSGSIS